MTEVAAVLLAAGASTRLGTPKQLVLLGGETLLQRSIRVAKEAALAPILVVLGCSVELIEASTKLDAVQIIFNPGWQEGMASSIRAGVAALRDAQGAVFMTCDMPTVTSTHLRALTASGQLTASSYAGRHGVPAYLPASAFAALMNLQGDKGARELLADAPAIELPGGELDIDTVETLRIAQQLYG